MMIEDLFWRVVEGGGTYYDYQLESLRILQERGPYYASVVNNTHGICNWSLYSFLCSERDGCKRKNRLQGHVHRRGGPAMMSFDDLTLEQKEQVRAAKTPEDILALAKQAGYELTEEELEAVSGGSGWCSSYACLDMFLNPKRPQ